MATFLDKPLPCTGVLRHLRRTIDYQAYRDILYWAVDRKLSPLDVFLVAICEAGLEIWPNQADLSIVISVPVDLRKTGDCDVANRVAAYNVVLPPGSSSDRERLIKAAAHSSQKLRNKSAAIAQLMKKALFVFLPVSLTTNLIKRQDANQINTYETTTFAFLEPFGSRLTAFGGVAIDNAYLLGGVGAPPGFRLALSPAAKKLNLTITFLDPAMGLETAENFIDCIVGRVRSIIKYKRDN
jgi:NRPS condensation-like uncharacterized protein